MKCGSYIMGRAIINSHLAETLLPRGHDASVMNKALLAELVDESNLVVHRRPASPRGESQRRQTGSHTRMASR